MMGVWNRMHFCVIKTALGLDCRAVMGDGALLNIQSGKALPYHQIRMWGEKVYSTLNSMLDIIISMNPQVSRSDRTTEGYLIVQRCPFKTQET